MVYLTLLVWPPERFTCFLTNTDTSGLKGYVIISDGDIFFKSFLLSSCYTYEAACRRSNSVNGPIGSYFLGRKNTRNIGIAS